MPRHFLTRLGLPPLELEPGIVFTIGRDTANKLPVPFSKVSRQHAEIRWAEGKPVLFDLGSSNGTFVGGRQIVEHALVENDEVQVGPFVGIYRLAADPASLRREVPASLVRTTGASPPLTGSIEAEGVAEFLQGLEFNAKSGTLNVIDHGVLGWVTVDAGAPTAAEMEGKLDLEAVLAILALKQGRFVFETELKTEDKRMATTITAILLEWSRRQPAPQEPNALDLPTKIEPPKV